MEREARFARPEPGGRPRTTLSDDEERRGEPDREHFLDDVASALAHLDDYAWLERSRFARSLAPNATLSGQQISRRLVDAIRALRPTRQGDFGSPEWRRYRHLLMRYTMNVNPRRIAEELNVSERQARRDHLDGLRALAESLWQASHRRATSNPISLPSLPIFDPASLADSESADYDQVVQSEVARLGARPATGLTLVESTVRGALSTVAALAATREVTFAIRTTPNPSFVAVDHAVLRQIVLNLLTWLIEAHRQTHLGVSIDAIGEQIQVAIAVQSTTSSQPVEPAPRDWSEPAPDEHRLEICRRLLAMHGGQLRLPDPDATRRQVAFLLPAVWQATILVIDDNPDFFRLFQRYLGDHAFRLHFASTSELALQLARTVRPDVITLDVMMPSQDGWEIMQSLKSDHATRDVPIIICSVLREEALARSLGAIEFLSKPVRQPALIAALDRCLTRRPASRSHTSG